MVGIRIAIQRGGRVMDDRTRRIIAKIKALQAKRVDAGATEDEAASAAELAAKLMAQYQIDAAAIGAASYDRFLLPIKGIGLHASKSHPCVYVSPGVQHITGCAIFLSKQGLYVVGDDVGRSMAHYLFDMVRNVIDAAWRRERTRRKVECAARWLKATGNKMPERLGSEIQDMLREVGAAFDGVARRSFGMGMASRICDRMQKMPPARGVPQEAVARIMSDKTEKESGSAKTHRGKYDLGAMHAGARAGADVPISMGVDTAMHEMLRIGGPDPDYQRMSTSTQEPRQ